MKNLYIIFLSLLFVAAQAQEQTSGEAAPVSKSGVPILPSAGDIAIGADALPYLNYIGNMFNGHAGNGLVLPAKNNIYLRYHISDNSAIRAILTINKTVAYNSVYVADDAARFANPLSQALVEDKMTTSINGYGINIAYQLNRGYGRLRGFYGAQINYGFARTVQNFAYGNNITVANPQPTSTNFIGNLNFKPNTLERDLEIDGGIAQNAGLGIVAGVEYYFLPKICIGGEIALGYNYNWGSQSNKQTEELIGSTVEKMDKPNAPGNSAHVLGTIRPANYGGLYLMFHF